MASRLITYNKRVCTPLVNIPLHFKGINTPLNNTLILNIELTYKDHN